MAHINKILASKTSRDDNKPPPLDLAVSDTIHKEDDVSGGVDAAEVAPNQVQPCLSLTPSSSSNKVFLSAEEDFHQELARHLGMSFDEHKPSSDNTKFVKDISENATASPAMMGKDNIAS